MNPVRDDLIALSDFAWGRLRQRMAGLTDAEYLWEPVPDCRTVPTLAWRLSHIVDFLCEDRNWPWLGQPARPADDRAGAPGTAAVALAELDGAYEQWHALLTATTDESLSEPIGPIAGPYARDTRRSFALHILDELIHHGAEAALLRDLYAASDQRVS